MKSFGDHEIIALVKKGNVHAFEHLVLRYQNKIITYLFYLTKNKSTAEELAQESFLKAYYNIKSLKNNHSFNFWIHRIAFHIFIDHQRSPTNTLWESLEMVKEDGVKSKGIEVRNLIITILDSLHPDEKYAIMLTAMFEFTIEEAAKIMNINRGTLNWRLKEGRQKFINYLLKYKIEITGIVIFNKKGVA